MSNQVSGISVLKKVNKTFKQGLSRTIAGRKGYNISGNYYIFSDPRGGSTWLMEIIQNITKAPVMWEPLHLDIQGSPFKEINFDWRQYIPENAQWDEAKELFDKLFTGKILIENILYHSSLFQLINSKNLLFKFCRGSALLPWLVKHFSFSLTPIYLVRHPFAVVSSQLHHGAWKERFSEFRIPDTPFNDLYIQHEAFLKTIKTQEEALVAKWCLANNVPLSHPENNKMWLTVNYEEFVLNPEKTISRILAAWRIEYDLSTINFEKDSKTTKASSPDLTVERLSNWQKQFSKQQLHDMGRVLDYFEISCYSKNNPLPEKVFNYGL